MDSIDERPAKRIKSDTETLKAELPLESSLDLVELKENDNTAITPQPNDDQATKREFSFDGETGLFGNFAASGMRDRGPIESDVGITEYIDPSIPPFAGIIKHRFTDFLVYEVGLDGQVIRLKDIKAPTKVETAQSLSVPSKSDEIANDKERDQIIVNPSSTKDDSVAPSAVHGTKSSIWNESIPSLLSSLIEPACKLDEFRQFIMAGPPAPRSNHISRGERTESTAVFKTNPISERDLRTTLHKSLRECFSEKLISETKELESGDQIVEIVWKGGGRGQKRQRQSRAEQAASRGNLPPYIHFTLQKTNREMHDALSSLCRTLRLQNRDIGSAGTKDKRAITVQRVSMKRGGRTLEDVWRAAKSGGGGGIRGSNRGGGRGGQFDHNGTADRGVRIGDLEYSDVMLDLGMSRGNKFVVTLRDVQVDSLDTVERAMGTLKKGGFINYYGMQRFGTSPIPTHVIGLALFRQDWALAVDLLLRERQGESEDIAFARKVYAEGKIAEALRLMPRRAVAERAILESFNKHGNTTDCLTALTQITKNLRMMYVHAWQSYVWNRVVSERISKYGCQKAVVGDLVYEGADDPDDLAAVATTSEEAVVESLDPDLTNDTPNLAGPLSEEEKLRQTSKVAKVKTLTQEDIDSDQYTIFDVVLPLPGFNVVYPANQLADVYRRIMKSDKIDPDHLFRKQKEYSLGGAYRKILHLPCDVSHRLLLYSSPSEDLAQSDEDALLGRPPPSTLPFNLETDTFPPDEGQHLALQIELTLGSSTYATMAMRELLKVRTNSQHQKSLTDEMEERHRLKQEENAKDGIAVTV